MKLTMKQVAVSLLATVLTTACTEEDSDEEATTTTATTETAPELTTTTTNITTVSDNMVPGSLAVTALRLQDGDPCEGTDGFFDCQPNLLKLYLSMGKSMVDMANGIVTEFSTLLADLPDSEGSIDVPDEDMTLEYKVTSATEFGIIISAADAPFMYLDVNDNVYHIMFDIGAAPAEPGEEAGAGAVETTITFTDADNFSVDLAIGGQDCDDEDVRAPSSIAINIDKVDGVAQGKAMLYMPRWRTQDPQCSDTPDDDSKAFIYTDFVGDDTNTTAALYALDSTVASTDDFADWEISDFCTNFDGVCNNGYGFGDPNPISSYKNNFCVTADDAEWETSCTSTSPLISTPTFSNATNWILPGDLEDLTVTLPSAL